MVNHVAINFSHLEVISQSFSLEVFYLLQTGLWEKKYNKGTSTCIYLFRIVAYFIYYLQTCLLLTRKHDMTY